MAVQARYLKPHRSMGVRNAPGALSRRTVSHGDRMNAPNDVVLLVSRLWWATENRQQPCKVLDITRKVSPAACAIL